MVRNAEDYDFFEGDEYDDNPRSSRRLRYRRDGSHSSGRRAGKLKVDSPTSKIFRRLALVTGLLSVVASAASAVHEIAPYAISVLVKVPGRYIALTAAVLIGCTLLLVIIARATMPRRSTHGGVGAGGIVSLVLSIVLLAIGVAAGVLFPAGLIQPDNDKAPVEDVAQMEQGIEQSAGACTSGWQGIDTGGVPGITTVQMCADTRVAFVAFDSDTAAAVGKAPIESKIAELLGEHADDAQAQGDWRLLSGKRWMVFGEAGKMTALQQQWGGDLTAVKAAQDAE